MKKQKVTNQRIKIHFVNKIFYGCYMPSCDNKNLDRK